MQQTIAADFDVVFGEQKGLILEKRLHGRGIKLSQIRNALPREKILDKGINLNRIRITLLRKNSLTK
jgi:hypothetical protein